MSDDNRAQTLVKCIENLIQSLESNATLPEVAPQLVNVFAQFMRTVHHDIVITGDKGPAVATAACIPLWEMLHIQSGLVAPLKGTVMGFVITMLTGLYPKARDRRCLFQHSGCLGSLGSPRVTLSYRLPMQTEITKFVTDSEPSLMSYKEVVIYVRNTLSVEENILSTNSTAELLSKTKLLTDCVLPHCVLVESQSQTVVPDRGDGPILIYLSCESESSIRALGVLQQTIWKYLILLHVYAPEEERSLINFLTNSTWAQRSVLCKGNVEISYHTLMAPVAQEAAVCASFVAFRADGPPDNSPLVPPRLLDFMFTSENRSLPSSPYGDLSKAFSDVSLMRRKASITQQSVERLEELIGKTIPQEIEFANESSSCRDCDKLTMLCRNLLMSPVARSQRFKGLSAHFLKRMLFSRKRSRIEFYEGPVFLPVASTLSDLFSNEDNKPLTTLERISTAPD
ncbi:hypothetical protein ERJ75_000835100 [Trypanosoma vivax]|nr:hypothetical protein ERJ75_000835100 [Trypanosoma vivax]